MINTTDLIHRFGEQELIELSDKQYCQTINHDVVQRAILDAESEAESYLNALGLVSRNAQGELVYAGQLPMPLIIRLCDMARYYLHEDGTTQIVQERYQHAIDWFKLVMKYPHMLTGIHQTPTQHNIVVMPNPKPNLWHDD